MVYNGYYKVMSNIPKMGHLPTPEKGGKKAGLTSFDMLKSSGTLVKSAENW